MPKYKKPYADFRPAKNLPESATQPDEMAVIRGTQFKQDVKRMQKRGKDMEKLKTIVRILRTGNPLPANYKDHPLSGTRKDLRDSHIEPDWLLLYKIEANALHLVRTGTHSDLFG